MDSSQLHLGFLFPVTFGGTPPPHAGHHRRAGNSPAGERSWEGKFRHQRLQPDTAGGKFTAAGSNWALLEGSSQHWYSLALRSPHHHSIPFPDSRDLPLRPQGREVIRAEPKKHPLPEAISRLTESALCQEISKCNQRASLLLVPPW